MLIFNKKEPAVLMIGDIISLLLSLGLMLAIRYGSILDQGIIYSHLAPFSILFVVWLAVFFIAGLYEGHTLIFQSRLPKILIKTSIINCFLAVIFFYLVPIFGIAPKANLFIVLIFSSFFIVVWRTYGYRLIYAKEKKNAIVIGTGRELEELVIEINQNERYAMHFASVIDTEKISGDDFYHDILAQIAKNNVTLVVLDLHNKRLEALMPHLYGLIFKNVQFVDIYRLYEDIFYRVPLSLVTYGWFLRNISISLLAGYDFLKRVMDCVFSFVLGTLSLVLYPFIMIAIKMDDEGPVYIFQERVGVNGKIIKTVKFRTMTRDDGGIASNQKTNRYTRVGPFLRKTRLDELPQFWNVLMGDMSLIGPRPELPSLAAVYYKEVPYYNTRHLIKPGLSGWAQLYHDKHPHNAADVEETKIKLSYDLYYIKNRSFFLDMKIALKTIKTLLSQSGR
ncbi:MAG: exopolysaccharide biosynthesis polyprenyl glycosylphosphotransferase [Candidatus Taylorbacteria bacterium]|nr:exopolysaccharide biosynthesis polyprenyl glycosylphosphotransferase [Candidatus Taylorbacteria bacterium]